MIVAALLLAACASQPEQQRVHTAASAEPERMNTPDPRWLDETAAAVAVYRWTSAVRWVSVARWNHVVGLRWATAVERAKYAGASLAREAQTRNAPASEPQVQQGGGASVWDRLAQCESGGDWGIATGNGYYGGLQWLPSTWWAYGGQGMPHHASREQQIAVAERLLAASSGRFTAWPGCRRKLGLP